jgi:hypothetical protein
MSEREDAQLDLADTLVRRHLSAELDGQRGRAEAAFLRHVGAAPVDGLAVDGAPVDGVPVIGFPTRTTRPRKAPQDAPPQAPFMRLRGWFFTLAGTAMAASIAGLLAAPAIFRQPSGGSSRNPNPPTHGLHEPMMQMVQDRTWDGGATVVDNADGDPVPARRIVRERLERARWYDPAQKAWNEVTIPRQDVTLREVDTY